jgi:thiol-disulfide isomerase/thioredoxin
MLSLVLGCALCGPIWADYGNALQSHKPILVEFSTDHCPPCRRQDAVLHELRVRVALRGFVCVHADDELAAALRVTTFPAVVIADASGLIVARAEGFQSADAVVALAKKVK